MTMYWPHYHINVCIKYSDFFLLQPLKLHVMNTKLSTPFKVKKVGGPEEGRWDKVFSLSQLFNQSTWSWCTW